MSIEIASLYATIGAKTEGLQAGLKDSQEKLGQFKISWNEVHGAIDVAERSFRAIKGALDETIGVTTEYADQVRDLSRLIGATPEESSKLIQAADDMQISYETMSAALEAAIRKGVKPTIEGLGELADEYNSIQDPIERSKYLMDNFGRSGADLGPLLERGSTGIKLLGDEAEKLGLIMNQESIKAARDYEIAIDGLNDSLMVLKINIGNEVIPGLTDLANLFSDLFTIKNFSEGADASAKFINNFFFGAKETATNFYETAKAKSEDLVEETNNLAGTMDDLSGSLDSTRDAQGDLAEQSEELARQEEAVRQSMEDLATFMDGRLGEENEQYEEKLGDLQTELEDTRLKIEELSNQDNLTEEQRGQLDELKGKYEDIQTQIKNNADEHDEATRRILFDLLQQQLAVDGLSTEEARALGNVAESWGLIDQPTKTAWDRMQDYIGSLGTAQINAEDLWTAVNNIPNEKTINITANVSSLEQYPWLYSDTEHGYQTGADFVVPPGFSGDQFPFRASSGERVQVTPAGEAGNEVKAGGAGNWGVLAAQIQELRNDILSQPRPATASEIARSVRDAILMVSG